MQIARWAMVAVVVLIFTILGIYSAEGYVTRQNCGRVLKALGAGATQPNTVEAVVNQIVALHGKRSFDDAKAVIAAIPLCTVLEDNGKDDFVAVLYLGVPAFQNLFEDNLVVRVLRSERGDRADVLVKFE